MWSLLAVVVIAPLLLGVVWRGVARTRMRPAVAPPKRFFVRYYEPPRTGA